MNYQEIFDQNNYYFYQSRAFSILKEQVYQYFAVALEDSSATLIPHKDVNAFIKDSASWIKNILNTISDRIHNTLDVISDHKIIDDRLNSGSEFSQAEEKLILNSLNPKKKSKD